MTWIDDLRAKRMKIEPLADYNGPVFVDDMDRYYADPDEAAEALVDNGTDPTTVLAFPCTVAKADTPCLVDVVSDAWFDELDESFDSDMPKAAVELLDAAQDAVKALAPVIWRPRLNERVELRARK